VQPRLHRPPLTQSWPGRILLAILVAGAVIMFGFVSWAATHPCALGNPDTASCPAALSD
jgi:hypothetical protein